MKIAVFILGSCVFVTTLWSQQPPVSNTLTDGNPTCGISDKSLQVPPTSYYNFPALGSSWTDPTFGCIGTRISNAQAEGQPRTIHVYSSPSALSEDDCCILVYRSGQFQIRDMSGNIIVPSSEFSRIGIYNIAQAQWAGPIGTGPTAVPNRIATNHDIYYITNQSIGLATFSIGACAPNCTFTTHILHTFAPGANGPNCHFHSADGDLSFDKNHQTISCAPNGTPNGVFPSSNGFQDAWITYSYAIDTDTVLGTIDTSGSFRPGPAFIFIDYVQMMPDNRLVLAWTANGSCTWPCSTGTHLFTSTGTWIKQLANYDNHATTGTDGTHQYYIPMDGNLGKCPANRGGVDLVDVDNGVALCAVGAPGPAFLGGHVSAQGSTWLITELQDGSPGTTTQYGTNVNGGTLTGWGVLYNELIMFNMKTLTTTKVTYRMMHSFTCDGDSGAYFATPKVSLSRSRRYVVFDSNGCTHGPSIANGGSDYADVFVFATGITPVTSGTYYFPARF